MGDMGGDSAETPPRGKPGANTTENENDDSNSETTKNNESKSKSKLNPTEKKTLEVDTALNTRLYQANVSNPPSKSPRPRGSTNNSHKNTNIEEKIGVCLEKFRCQHNNFTGILYAGPLGVVFLGRFLLFEWTVVLQWEDVIKVKRKVSTPTALGNSNSNETTAIRIEARSNTNKIDKGNANRICDFEGFFDAQKTLETLIGLHNDGIFDHTNTSRITKRGSIVPVGSVGVALRRTHSSPAEPISNLFNFDDESSVVLRNNSNTNSNTNNANKTTMEDLRNQYSASNRAAHQASNSKPKSIILSPPRTQAIRRDSTFRSPPRGGGGHGNSNTNINGNKSSTENTDPNRNKKKSDDSNNNNSNNKNNTNEDQLLDAEWRKVCNDVAKYPQVPVRDRELSLEGNDDDLDVFVEKFVGDDAAFSWSKFMTDIMGDTHVHATKWVASGGDSNGNKNDNGSSATATATSLTRTIEYTHPVNAPMAPPTARARKEQTLKRYGNQRGLVIETKTFVRDVPMTDCFYVRDVLQVERQRNGSLVVNIRFEVVFIKSNMFRALIARTTTSEFQKIMTDLASYLCNNCGKNGSGNRDNASSTTKEKRILPIPSPRAIQPDNNHSPAIGKGRSSNNGSSNTTYDQCWKLLVVVLLLWMAWMQARVWNETSSLRDDLRELQSTLSDLETKRATNARLIEDDYLREWKTTFGDLETKQVVGMQSLRDDLSDLKSTLLELEAASRRAITTCSDNSAATTSTITTDEDLQQQQQQQG